MAEDNIIYLRAQHGTAASVVENLPAPDKIKDIIVIVTTDEGTQVRMSAMKLKDIAYACKSLDFEMMEILRETGSN
jgi:hypothetical protein